MTLPKPTPLPRLEDEDIRNFAQLMIDEHQAAGASIGALAAQEQLVSQSSAVSELLERKSLDAVARIGSAEEGDVDRAYIDAQVIAHTEADGLLENLIEGADSEALEAQLVQLRSSVQGHLQAARELQAEL